MSKEDDKGAQLEQEPKEIDLEKAKSKPVIAPEDNTKRRPGCNRPKCYCAR
ncbi:hypothetical protein JMY81_01050 [Brenneria goodwinii]|uniref:hypothetical protein n=1 Tax=Brenneria goodwinii TaxID=1109412 RepID=UPI001601D199|nr:hypothetical protein [Brenneria goodwinii]MCG8155184.1 hypothetical protein [Brenneria goodwinii]MCG8159428.1 hypothetical protein [Brenneria goodwinii]MCG8164403.1 hypothetical protein [Brenneria goodwinii]MCG8169031.1 hypothetical protein [Brenneria goodwinii]MCG8173287.1 hypothetical protein [Brenneria goodwinii]